MARHIHAEKAGGPTEEQLLVLQERLNDAHHALQEMSQAFIKLSLAYVEVFEHIEEPKPDPQQLVLEI